MASSNSSLCAQYPCQPMLIVANFVSIKLSKANYGRWKTQMLGLLESQDLLCFTNGTNPAPAEKVSVCDSSTNSTKEIENPNYLLWRRSDRLVKGWIIGSLSEDVLDMVAGLSTARDVWTKLENNFLQDSQEQPFKKEDSEKHVQSDKDKEEEKDLSWYLPLQKATLRGDWESAKNFFDNIDREAVTANITPNDYTTLHVAVATGKEAIHFVDKLVKLPEGHQLEQKQNNKGNTALVVAACVGNFEAAKILVKKNPKLALIRNQRHLLPIHYAAANAHEDLLQYLLTVTEDNVGPNDPNPFEDQSGVELLINVIVSELFDVALVLVHKYRNLATLKHQNGDTPLKAISRKASAFRSGCCLNFWERLIYFCVPVKFKNYHDDCNGSDIENPTVSSQALKQTCGWVRLNTAWEKLILVVCKVIGLLVPSIKHIQKKKKTHKQALQLVSCLCKQIKSLDKHHSYRSHYQVPVLLAASLGIHEVIEEIVNTFPNAAWSTNEDNHNILQIAVIHRCEKVFNLIYQMNAHKHYLTTPLLPDNLGNTILHLAGRLAPFHKLNSVSGAALQMQRELQWFKEVEKFVKPAHKEMENSANETPAMVFTKEHKNLVIEGEKWMKDTANSCTIAASLIATVVFAAAITVPGGNNGDSGLPIMSEQIAFIIFAVSDAVSLFTSTTSVLMFLSILTSRYAEGDFLHVLPKRLIIGLVTLFLSITSMMIAFSATLYLVFCNKRAWILIPVAVFACLPVSSFLSLQFPLLVDAISSTCGPGIFRKQSKHPFY